MIQLPRIETKAEPSIILRRNKQRLAASFALISINRRPLAVVQPLDIACPQARCR
ncbi:hypothetical protein V4R08_13515 [Nitrobacter sp. NHB1]|uniref:hypothetical protein n=1 Tax=Nitrobacter sp. NHB1 TaxID=3119830 RepID=UPI003000648C